MILTPFIMAVMIPLVFGGFLAIDEASVDWQALALAGALPGIPFALYLVVKGVGGDRTQGVLLAIAILIVLTANFRQRAYDDKDIDFQIALRLAAIAGMFGISLLFIHKIMRQANMAVLASWLCFFGYTALTSAYAVAAAPAFVATASLLGAFLFISYLCIQYGSDRATWAVGTAASIMFLASLVVYFVAPNLGRMSDWVGTDFVVTSRLQGVFGSSNGTGMAGAASLFLILAFFPSDTMRALIWKYVGASSALICLVLSNNRMAMLALLVSVTTLYILKGPIARRALMVFAAVFFVVSCAALLADNLMTLVSRSSDDAEILTLTGRTRIWPVVIDLWRQAPLFGYGFGSALYILPVHPDLFSAAAHSHNLYLEQLFSGGLVGLCLFVCSLAITCVVAWRRANARELALLLFFLIYGLTEPVIYGPVSFPLIIMFLPIARVLTGSPQHDAREPIAARASS